MDQSSRFKVAPRHTLLHDAQGFGTAILLVALGLAMLRSAQLLTGGIPGLAFLMSYVTGWPLGWTFGWIWRSGTIPAAAAWLERGNGANGV